MLVKKKRANTNLKTWKSPQELRSTLGGPEVGGRWCSWESIQQMAYITDDWQFIESLPSSAAAPARKGQIKGKEVSWELMGMRGQKQQAGFKSAPVAFYSLLSSEISLEPHPWQVEPWR